MHLNNRIIPVVVLFLASCASELAAQTGSFSVFASYGSSFALGSSSASSEWGGGAIIDGGVDYTFAPGASAGAVIQRTTLQITADDDCACRVGSRYTSTGVGPRLRYAFHRAGAVSVYSATNLQVSLVQTVNGGAIPITTTNLSAELVVGADYRISPLFSIAAETGYAVFDIGIATVHTVPLRLRLSLRP